MPRTGREPRGPREVEKVQRLLYHVPDAAFQLSVSPSEVWRLIEAGRLRRTRIGKRVLISHAAILEFIAASTEGEGAARPQRKYEDTKAGIKGRL